jgi:rhodanese-related sulfurtransferase
MESIHPAQIDDWIAQARAESPDAKPIVLDVREPWELQTASVKAEGFELLAMPMHSVTERYLELDRSQPIACLCHHGVRSAQVAHFLTQHGFEQVVNIHGGINAWSAQHDPSVSTY